MAQDEPDVLAQLSNGIVSILFHLPRDSMREISRTWYEVMSTEGAEFSKRDDI